MKPPKFTLFKNPHPRPGGPEFIGSCEIPEPGIFWIEADLVPHETGKHFEGRLVRAEGTGNRRQGALPFNLNHPQEKR